MNPRPESVQHLARHLIRRDAPGHFVVQASGQPGHEEYDAAEADDVNQEKIVKGRR